MLLADVVAAADRAAGTPSRLAKRGALAEVLRRAEPHEVGLAATLLAGAPRQGRVGVGWSTVGGVSAPPAATPSLTLADLDRALDDLGALAGPGSGERRQRRLADLLARATEAEQSFVRRLLLGELRQGALEAVVVDALAAATEVPATVVRRALMLSGDLGRTATVARTEGRSGLAAVTLQVGNGVQPMLAATSPTVTEALADLGGLAVVEWKLDGARVQVHRRGDDVRIFTRNLNDVTDRLPGVVAVARSLPADRLVLDGEVLGLDEDARPEMFQDTMARLGVRATPDLPGSSLRPWFFDVLHVDGEDLLDRPLAERRAALTDLAGPHQVPGVATSDATEAEAFAAAALASGHEGVMVKDPTSPYAAGRRGKTWRKVKPVHLYDLVVLAAEWGGGRRRGWLSNLHLGALDADGRPVMVGKTFKGLTDDLLRWQTAELQARAVGQEGHVVHVRPDLVVEVAIDGVQRSSRYPGGLALRFARVRRYRPDKTASEADSIEALRALLAPSG